MHLCFVHCPIPHNSFLPCSSSTLNPHSYGASKLRISCSPKRRKSFHHITCLSPGRADQFSNTNGESLRDKQQRNSSASKVSTLEKDVSFDTVLQELSAIQSDGPRNVAILGTRHTSYLHQQIIELLTYANVLVGNHVFTSGAGGTNAAVIKGALRAERPDLLTVVLPQSLLRQPGETQDQLRKVTNLIEMKKNDPLPLDIASQLCNSDILSRCTHFIAFAFHDSDVV